MYAVVTKNGNTEYNTIKNILEVDMKSFKDYSRDAYVNGREEEGTANAEELTRRIAQAYNGKSNADILQGILKEAEKSKRAGSLSNEEIEAFYQNFSPMLNGFQRKKLREVVERLKEI